MTFCEKHEYEHTGDECPACQPDAAGQCRENDTTLVIDGETVTQIEDVSLKPTPEHDSYDGLGLDDASATFEGSFTVKFEDEDDALEFWDWLHENHQ